MSHSFGLHVSLFDLPSATKPVVYLYVKQQHFEVQCQQLDELDEEQSTADPHLRPSAHAGLDAVEIEDGWHALASTEISSKRVQDFMAFVRVLRVMLVFFDAQDLLFKVFDHDDKKRALGGAMSVGTRRHLDDEPQAKHSVGFLRTSLPQLVRSRPSLRAPLCRRREGGAPADIESLPKASMLISVEEQIRTPYTAVCAFTARHLDLSKGKLLGGGGSNAFLVISKKSATAPGCGPSLSPANAACDDASNDNFVPVFKSEISGDVAECRWKFELPLHVLCNSDPLRPLLFEVMRHVGHGKSAKLIGCFETSWKALQQLTDQEPQTLLNRRKMLKRRKQSRRYEGSGTLTVECAQQRHVPTLAEFLAGGLAFRFAVAIDFTASNGPADHPQSRHAHSEATRRAVDRLPGHSAQQLSRLKEMLASGSVFSNPYERALVSLGSLILPYCEGADPARASSLPRIACYGFGAQDPPGSGVRHCFSLAGSEGNDNDDDDDDNGSAAGLGGVLSGYYRALARVQLSGPTCMTRVIERYVRNARAGASNADQFTVVLILTDGCIDDEDQVMAALQAADAALAPLFIVCVGVGRANFNAMRSFEKRTPNLFTFIEFAESDSAASSPGSSWSSSSSDLSKKIMQMIPSVFLAYAERAGWSPAPPCMVAAPTVARAAVEMTIERPASIADASPVEMTVDALSLFPSSKPSLAPLTDDDFPKIPLNSSFARSTAAHAVSFPSPPSDLQQNLNFPPAPTAAPTSTSSMIDVPEIPDIPEFLM